jgi:hypothetical protein
MSARLTEIQRQLGLTRRRLEDLAGRLAALRARLGEAAAAPAKAEAPPDRPLFPGLGLGDGALDDVELTFEVLDTEDPDRDRR